MVLCNLAGRASENCSIQTVRHESMKETIDIEKKGEQLNKQLRGAQHKDRDQQIDRWKRQRHVIEQSHFGEWMNEWHKYIHKTTKAKWKLNKPLRE